ncbi:MAG: NifB/NifX family molybdenum-iron cluster-binding protein [Microcystaceae cyanobacterium]
MKIAVVSQDFQTISGKTGQARQFLVYEAIADNEPTLSQQLTLADGQPTFHDLHNDDTTPHPLDQFVLITGEAGEGLSKRLSRRGIQVYITDEKDPVTAVKGVMSNSLHTISEMPHKDDGSC